MSVTLNADAGMPNALTFVGMVMSGRETSLLDVVKAMVPACR
jgi:hypothetical protein